MAKKKPRNRPAKRKSAKRPKKPLRSGKRPTPKRKARKPVRAAKTRVRKARPVKKRVATRRKAAPAPAAKAPARVTPARAKPTRVTPARLSRERRVLTDTSIPTPPSSLDMDPHGSAARTGRAEMAESRVQHASMSPSIRAGDVDVNLENAYFSGDEAPGGDNPTPDQEVVDEIGRALGVEYQDAEELGGDKITGRDKHRWELDPASSEDYRDRKN